MRLWNQQKPAAQLDSHHQCTNC